MGRAAQIERIIAKGQLLPFRFAQHNVAAAQAAAAMNIIESETGADVTTFLSVTEHVIPFDFEVVAIGMDSNAARTAGTLTVDATINGTVTGLQAALDATNTLRDTGVQQRGLDVGVAGDRVGVKLTTDAGWTPITADIAVVVYVLVHLEGI